MRELLERGRVLVAPGIYDGLSARIAASFGFDAYYLSGFSVAGAAFGVPDIGLVTATEVEAAIGQIIDQLPGKPLIVDADNGYGAPANVERTVRRFERLGVACIQLEDQVSPKRCGHMDGKEIVPIEEAEQRIRTANEARTAKDMLIMARTDAIATDGLDEALRRAERFALAVRISCLSRRRVPGAIYARSLNCSARYRSLSTWFPMARRQCFRSMRSTRWATQLRCIRSMPYSASQRPCNRCTAI